MELKDNMPSTYEKIQTYTLGSAASSIDFTTIPATYTDLRIVWVYKPVTASNYPYLQFNGDTSAIYSFLTLYGNGTAGGGTGSPGSTGAFLLGNVAAPTTQWQVNTIDVFSYTGGAFKSLLNTYSGDINGSGTVSYGTNLWKSTAAVTSIKLLFNGGSNIATGSSATLYGIKAA
jgi:hypothetical protein